MYLTTFIKHTYSYNDLLKPTLNNTYEKITLKLTPKPFNKLQKNQIMHIQNCEQFINDAYLILKPFKDSYTEQYYTFKIPKHSGGLRTINAPLEDFKQALSNVKDIFERKIRCLEHKAAYAYIKKTSVQQALQQHQKNNSNWYLKLDLTDFFPNCSPEIIYKQLKQLYPFYYLSQNSKKQLKTIIQICSLNNGLPQGTPISPLLTNLIMVPIDYEITKYLSNISNNTFVYTRYADDMLISAKKSFNWEQIQQDIQNIIQPFQIKQQKTRYGSKAGSNWNLGLMLNKDNNITLGSAKKKIINAMLNNFLRDYKHNIIWPKDDVYTLQGNLSYLKNIEPAYYRYMLQKYEAKYDLDYKALLKIIL